MSNNVSKARIKIRNFNDFDLAMDAPSDVHWHLVESEATRLSFGPSERAFTMAVWAGMGHAHSDEGAAVRKVIVFKKDALRSFSHVMQAARRSIASGRVTFTSFDVSSINEVGEVVRFDADVFDGMLREFDVVHQNGHLWKFILGHLSQNKASRGSGEGVYVEAVAGGPHDALMPWRHTIGGMLASIRRLKRSTAKRRGTMAPAPLDLFDPWPWPFEFTKIESGRPVKLADITPAAPAGMPAKADAAPAMTSAAAAVAPVPQPVRKCFECRHYIPRRPAMPAVSPSASIHGDANTYGSIQRAYQDMKDRIDQEALMCEQMKVSGRSQYAAPPRYAAFCRIARGGGIYSEPTVKNADGHCADFQPRRTSLVVCESCRHYRRAEGPTEERRHREKMALADFRGPMGSNFLSQSMDIFGREKASEVSIFTDLGYSSRLPKWTDACAGYMDIGGYVDAVVFRQAGMCQSYKE